MRDNGEGHQLTMTKKLDDLVVKHIQTKVKEWYTKKRDAIAKVEPEYVKILEL